MGVRGSRGLPKAALAVAVIIGVGALTVVSAGCGVSDGPGTPTPSATVTVGRSVPANGMTLGWADAPVTVSVYSDFQCPFCRRAALEVVPALKTNYLAAGKAKLIFKNFAFLGDESTWAAEAAACAADQNRFWDYHDKLFEEQRGENTGAFKVENLKRFAREIGLNGGEFDTCFDEGKYTGQIADEISEAERRGLNSVPTFFVGETGVQYSSFEAASPSIGEAIEAALQGTSLWRARS